MADEHKAKGNAAFTAGKYQEAIEHFSDGIKVDPNNHVLYSNRSAAQASLKKYSEALEDAQKVVDIKPEWPKGYSRLGAANVGLGNWDDAVEAYKRGLQLEPQNETAKKALEDTLAGRAKARSGGAGGVGGGLFGADFMGRVAMDSQTRPLLGDPEFMSMLRDVQQNPMQNMTKYLSNPKFQLAMQVGLGMNIMTGGGADSNGTAEDTWEEEMPDAPKGEDAAPRAEPASQPSRAAEPEPMSEDDKEAAEATQAKEKALQEKELGNAAYKAKRFDEAIEHYDAAIALDDTDISFLTNRAAVYFEKGEYDACIADCDKAVERGRELRQDYKLIGKALARKGNALVKQDKLEEAVEVYHKALTEHRNADTLKRLNDTERTLKDRKEKAYINLDISNEEREKGNQSFKDQDYPEAVKHYTEALQRGPPAVNLEAYKLYSNRAACFTKLGAYPDGVKDADECIRLKPDFPKGYSRKGHLQFFMKDYDKAIATYQEGLDKADKDNEELKNGITSCIQAINQMRTGQASEEDVKQRQARAMQDPDVQRILTDPVMRQVLDDLQTDPKNSQHHLQHPQIRANIEKLVSAGLVQMR